MYWQKRGNKYSFVYYDDKLKKNIRLRRSEIPANIRTEADADRFCRVKDAEFEAAKFRVLRKLEWKNKFYNFERDLLPLYVESRKKIAPNSWENDLYYLEQYVFHFFLNIKECNNLGNWELFFKDFRNWIETVEKVKGKKGDGLAYSTMNHCIKALNTFLHTMEEEAQIEQAKRCKVFSKDQINRKTIESVITDQVFEATYKALLTINELFADKYYVARFTGARDSEINGFSLGDIRKGEPNSKMLRGALRRNGVKTYGHIFLRDQVKDNVRIRKENGEIPRKLLKHKKKTDKDKSRFIPIMDAKAWNILVKRFNLQQELFQKKTYGSDKRNYLLFDGINKNNYAMALRKAAEIAKVKHHSPHDSRHTFATNLAGSTYGDHFLCQLILGHRDRETTENYLHLFEEIHGDLANEQDIIEGLDYVDEGMD